MSEDGMKVLNPGPDISEDDAEYLAKFESSIPKQRPDVIPKYVKDALRARSPLGRQVADLVVGNVIYRVTKRRRGFSAVKYTLPVEPLTPAQWWAAQSNVVVEYIYLWDVPASTFADWIIRYVEYDRVGPASAHPIDTVVLNQTQAGIRDEAGNDVTEDPTWHDHPEEIKSYSERKKVVKAPPLHHEQISAAQRKYKPETVNGWTQNEWVALRTYVVGWIVRHLSDTVKVDGVGLRPIPYGVLISTPDNHTYRVKYADLIHAVQCNLCNKWFHPRQLHQHGHCQVCEQRCPTCKQWAADAEYRRRCRENHAAKSRKDGDNPR